jgi:hypothetical protein
MRCISELNDAFGSNAEGGIFIMGIIDIVVVLD